MPKPSPDFTPDPKPSKLLLEGVGHWKWRWVLAAKAAGLSLFDWVVRTLNARARAELDVSPDHPPHNKPRA